MSVSLNKMLSADKETLFENIKTYDYYYKID